VLPATGVAPPQADATGAPPLAVGEALGVLDVLGVLDPLADVDPADVLAHAVVTSRPQRITTTASGLFTMISSLTNLGRRTYRTGSVRGAMP
jgi:hypothetical protein